MADMVEEFALYNQANLYQSPSPQSLHAIAIAGGAAAASSMKDMANSSLQDHDSWLPITESRNANLLTCVFHLLSSGIGIQALLLPLAFSILGWYWGIICLSLAFAWQLYTTWLLVHLHEAVPGTRFSRFLHLAIAAFGPKLGKMVAIFPVMYLSGGSCVILIITGGRTMALLFQTLCSEGSSCDANRLTGTEWFLVFTCVAIILAQRPNLNSIAGFSLLAAITGIAYFTLIWASTIPKDRPQNVSHAPSHIGNSDMAAISAIFNALGMLMLSFRGHNVVLEIQGTLPSNSKHPSSKPMWRGVLISYLVIALCIYPLAIVEFWAYGDQVPKRIGTMSIFLEFYSQNVSKLIKGLTYILVLANCLTSFQIYAMPAFDNLEMRYTSSKNKPCSRWVRTGIRIFFGGLTFFIAVTFPFLPSLSGLIGGLASPLTYVYPCFMWITIKKPHRNGIMWCVNLVLGCLGLILTVLLVLAAAWTLKTRGLDANFFKP